jgi:hypothetical protein
MEDDLSIPLAKVEKQEVKLLPKTSMGLMALWPSLGTPRKQSGISFYEIKKT